MARSHLGFSLAEASIALALLTATIIFSATIYQTSFNMSRRLEARLDASYEARRQLVAARHWLKDPANFRSYAEYVPPAASGSEVEVNLTEFETASPNRTFETDFGADQRAMEKSFLLLRVKVTLQNSVSELTGVVGEPGRQLSATEPIKLEPSVSFLSADEESELTATLRDSSGRQIEDAFFQWTVRPVTGVVTLKNVSRDGRVATVKNISYKRDGTPIHTGGTCKVGVGTVYRGEEVWVFTNEITLGE